MVWFMIHSLLTSFLISNVVLSGAMRRKEPFSSGINKLFSGFVPFIQAILDFFGAIFWGQSSIDDGCGNTP